MITRGPVATVAWVVLGAVCLADARAADKTAQKVFIPFDFESKFDEDGEYSETMGFMFWKKIERKGGFVIPESMEDVRSVCSQIDFHPNDRTPLDEVARVVKEVFEGQYASWGKLERVPGTDQTYDFWLRVYDFTGDTPRKIYEVMGVRLDNVHKVPHLHVKNALMKLYNELPQRPTGPDPEEVERWEKGPNLVLNGDIERRGRAGPKYWEKLKSGITWAKTPQGEGRCVRFEMDEAIAGGPGMLYYSNFFEVDEGSKYQFQYRWRSEGPTPKIFIKCYDEIPEYDEKKRIRFLQKRECYRSQQQPKGPKNTWNTHTEDFTPKHTKYTPKWGRVMLYGYWPAGVIYFDDVIVKLIKPRKAPPKKRRRHSMETGVHLDEYEKEDPKYRKYDKTRDKGKRRKMKSEGETVDDLEQEGSGADKDKGAGKDKGTRTRKKGSGRGASESGKD